MPSVIPARLALATGVRVEAIPPKSPSRISPVKSVRY
jgi:hypothetical protein